LATDDHGSRETFDGISDIASQKKLLQKNASHGTSSEAYINPYKRTVFMLRPVSKNPVSTANQNQSFDFSGLIPLDKPISPSTRAAIAAAVAAAGGPPVQNRKPTLLERRSGLLPNRTLSSGEMHQGHGNLRNN